MKKLIPTMIVMSLLLALGQVYAEPPGNKPPGGSGGSGKGGFGELGDGCVTFLSPGGPGTVHDDGFGTYCNGSDGQVSVPVHLRLDTKKFNPGDRYFSIEGDCSADPPTSTQALCDSGVDGLMLNVTVVDELGTTDLNWTEMTTGEESANARMGIKIDNSHFLYFDSLACSGSDLSPPRPIHVRCDDDNNGDTFCDLWTISTYPDFRDTGFDDSASHACFKSGANGIFYSEEVKADFTMEVCVMGVSCPPPPTP